MSTGSCCGLYCVPPCCPTYSPLNDFQVASRDRSVSASGTWCLLRPATRRGYLRLHEQFAHAAEGCPVERIVESSGTERAVHRCACCRALAMEYNEQQWTYRMCLAKCSLLVKLRLQGGNSVQKNRCPFFFFEGLLVSLVTLSLSDPSLSSSSPSPIRTSC